MTPRQLLEQLSKTLFQTSDTTKQQHTDCCSYNRDEARAQRKIQTWRTAARTGEGIR